MSQNYKKVGTVKKIQEYLAKYPADTIIGLKDPNYGGLYPYEKPKSKDKVSLCEDTFQGKLIVLVNIPLVEPVY